MTTRVRERKRCKDVVLAGGASIAQQYLAARLIDEVNISLVPLFLRGGERLFDNLGAADLELEQYIEQQQRPD